MHIVTRLVVTGIQGCSIKIHLELGLCSLSQPVCSRWVLLVHPLFVFIHGRDTPLKSHFKFSLFAYSQLKYNEYLEIEFFNTRIKIFPSQGCFMFGHLSACSSCVSGCYKSVTVSYARTCDHGMYLNIVSPLRCRPCTYSKTQHE